MLFLFFSYFDNYYYMLYTCGMRELIVNKKYDKKKLNNLLLDTFPELSLNVLYKALRKKDIRVNDVKISDNVVIKSGDKIRVFIPDEKLFNNNVDIIYEDENIAIINKPSGIEVFGDNSLTTRLFNYYSSEVFPCHRLDRNTSGIILFAKNKEALNILLEKFKSREIEKHYLTKVFGVPSSKESVLIAYLFKDSKKSYVYISDVPKKGYEKIVTEYKVISSNIKENTSILDVNLHTGKTNQIRAHLAHIGHPIIGDGKYGNRRYK